MNFKMAFIRRLVGKAKIYMFFVHIYSAHTSRDFHIFVYMLLPFEK
jgi:hypothetical protein